jgi:putative membrane protein
MTLAHEPHTHADGGLETLLPLVGLVVVAATYLLLATRRAHEPRGWSRWRSASFLVGLALLVLTLTPQLSPFPPGDFRGHMHQHLLVGMYAPLGLALGAPSHSYCGRSGPSAADSSGVPYAPAPPT